MFGYFSFSALPLFDEIRFERIGVKIAQTFNKGFKWQHEAITALNRGNQASTIEVTKDHAVDWYMGKDIRPEKSQSKGDVLVTYQKQVIGLGKWVNGKIKK